MTKRNLCDTCLHHAVCRHSTDPAGTAMVRCTHYVRRELNFARELLEANNDATKEDIND